MLWEVLFTSQWLPALHFLWMLGHLPGWVIKSLSMLIIFALFLLTEEASCAPTVIISFISSAQGWRTVTGETNRPQEEGVILLKPSYPIQTPGPEMGELEGSWLRTNVIDFLLIGFFLSPATVKCLQEFSFQNNSKVTPSREAKNQEINNAETASEASIYPATGIFIYRKAGHSSLVW